MYKIYIVYDMGVQLCLCCLFFIYLIKKIQSQHCHSIIVLLAPFTLIYIIALLYLTL